MVSDLKTTGTRGAGTFSVTSAFQAAYGKWTAYEYQYAPTGRATGLCASTWPGQVPQAGFKVRMEPCTTYSNSLWAVNKTTPTTTAKTVPYWVTINAASTTYNPLVLTHPVGYPTDTPSPWVDVEPLRNYGSIPAPDNQEWRFANGTVNAP